ncbi:MAG: PepSY-associated TM helix domain-containing protein [Pirellulales bacterium]
MQLRRLNYLLHVWSGAVLGCYLYLLCFSGAIIVFKDEMVGLAARQNAAPPHSAGSVVAPSSAPAAPSLDAVVESVAQQLPPDDPRRRLTFPLFEGGAYELRSYGGKRVSFDAGGNPAPEPPVALADFFVNLHTRIFGGHPGRWIVGVAGFGMLVSMLTGLFVHRRLFSGLFRAGPGLRGRLVQWHKWIGLSTFIPLVIITLTGVWLGLYTLVAPWVLPAAMRDAVFMEYPTTSLAPDRSLTGLLRHAQN